MKISIITVSYNSESTIEDTIKSVLSQSYSNIEYIVIDGASTDATLQIVNKYKDAVDIVFSEPDKGIYDAMNKGIALATGDVIGILNSDDFYVDEYVIESVIKEFEIKKVDCVYADLIYVKPDNLNKTVRYYDSSNFSPKKIAYGWMPAHPTLFVKKSIYEKLGIFKTDYKIAADYEIIARFFGKYKISYSYIKKPIVKMRVGGVSTNGFKSAYINNIENIRACKSNDIYTNIFMIMSRYPAKLIGCLKKK